MKKILSNRKQRGFTLIELLIVIAIISVLSTTLLGNFQASRQKARDAVRMADLRTINNAILAYIADHGEPPLDPGTILVENPVYSVNTETASVFAFAKTPVAYARGESLGTREEQSEGDSEARTFESSGDSCTDISSALENYQKVRKDNDDKPDYDLYKSAFERVDYFKNGECSGKYEKELKEYETFKASVSPKSGGDSLPQTPWFQQLGAALSPYLSKPLPTDPCGSRCKTEDGHSYSYVYQRGSSAQAGSGNLLATDNDYSIYVREFEGKPGNFGFSTAIITSF